MKNVTIKVLAGVAWILMVTSLVAAGAPEKQVEKAAFIGQPCFIVAKDADLDSTDQADTLIAKVYSRYREQKEEEDVTSQEEDTQDDDTQ